MVNIISFRQVIHGFYLSFISMFGGERRKAAEVRQARTWKQDMKVRLPVSSHNTHAHTPLFDDYSAIALNPPSTGQNMSGQEKKLPASGEWKIIEKWQVCTETRTHTRRLRDTCAHTNTCTDAARSADKVIPLRPHRDTLLLRLPRCVALTQGHQNPAWHARLSANPLAASHFYRTTHTRRKLRERVCVREQRIRKERGGERKSSVCVCVCVCVMIGSRTQTRPQLLTWQVLNQRECPSHSLKQIPRGNRYNK